MSTPTQAGASQQQASQQPSIVLSTPADAEWLSPALCLFRSQIEYFAARPQDLTAKNRSGGNKAAVIVGQVGIRCVWCKHRPRGERAKGSELYPSNIGLIHQAVRNYQRHHYKSCTQMPAEVRAQIEQAKTQPGRKRQSKSNSKDYWSQSAREAGLVDDNGIFFAEEVEVEVETEAEQQVEADDEEEVEAEAEAEAHPAAEVREADAAAAAAAPLPFDSIALFGPGLGLIDGDDSEEIVDRPVHKVGQEGAAAAAVEAVYPSALTPAPAPVHVAHHPSTAATTTTTEADDAILHEALAILSDDAEDEVGSDDGHADFEPLPMRRKEELHSTYSTAMSIPPPAAYHQHHQHQQNQHQLSGQQYHQQDKSSAFPTTATNFGRTAGTLSEGSAPAPTWWYGSQGPSHTRDQHPLAYANGMFPSSSGSGASPYGQYQQPRRHSTMGSSYHTAVEQRRYQAQQGQHRQPRRFSVAGAVGSHYMHQATEEGQEQQRQHRQHVQSFDHRLSSTSTSTSAMIAPMIPFASPNTPAGASSYAQAPAPLAMPLPLPLPSTMAPTATAMTAKRRSSVVSSTSDSGCNSPAIATPSTSRSSSYGVVTADAIAEEAMVFPTASVESNKRARYE